MPKVPTYDNFTVAPSGGSSMQMSRAPDSRNLAAEQAQQFGNSMLRMGESFSRIEVDMQQQANQLRIDDAINRAKEEANRLTFDKSAGFANIKGIDALERQSGKPLADEYADNLRQSLDKISGSLGNDAQRRAFAMHSNDILTSFHGQAVKHEADQFRNWSVSVNEDGIRNRQQTIGLNYNNPEAVDQAINGKTVMVDGQAVLVEKGIRQQVYELGRSLGKSAEWVEAETRKATSNAHKIAIAAAIENNDITYADGYLKKYSKDMDADDLLRVRGLITKEMDSRVALTTASDVMRVNAPKIVTSDADRAFNIAIQTESGGRQFAADGKTPLTSNKGAIGIAQVMPTTAPEAAKLAGLPWDENRYKTDPKYNEALGRAYFQKQLQDFGGNLAHAYAAYNAGPGALRKALDEAEKDVKTGAFRGDPGADYWLTKLPKETQNYVAKNMAAYEKNEGKFQKPTLQDLHAEVRERIGTDNPQRLKLALDETTRQYEEANKAIKQREDEAVVAAQEALVANGGNWGALPVRLKSAVPAGKVDDLMGFAKKLSSGENIATDWNVYTQLRARAANDPTGFGSTDLRLYYGQLAPAQREQLLDLQTKLKDPKNAPTVQTFGQQLTTAHNLLGFGSGDAEKKGQFDDFVTQAVAAETREKGRELTFEERDKIIKRSMLPTSGWFSDPVYKGGNVKQAEIPSKDRDLIVAALKAEGVPANETTIRQRFNLRYGIK